MYGYMYLSRVSIHIHQMTAAHTGICRRTNAQRFSQMMDMANMQNAARMSGMTASMNLSMSYLMPAYLPYA